MTEYDEREIPTRPDLPNTAARKCKHCGKVYGEHTQGVKPHIAATCGGLRRDYAPEEHSPSDVLR